MKAHAQRGPIVFTSSSSSLCATSLPFLTVQLMLWQTLPNHRSCDDQLKTNWTGCVPSSPDFVQLAWSWAPVNATCSSSVIFLGHIVSSDGVSTDQEKVTAVREWPTPTTATQVRAFLGLCSYYRRFVRGFADVAKPLYKLTEKGSQFAWSDECESAFKLLKAKLTSAPVLAYPTSEDPFILDTNASNQGIGAVLSQVHEGQEQVVAYYSRSLMKEETTVWRGRSSWQSSLLCAISTNTCMADGSWSGQTMVRYSGCWISANQKPRLHDG